MFSLNELTPKIYHLEFKNGYDLAMAFLRYQEFYESDCQHIKNSSFTIVECMKWYAYKHSKNGTFSYTKDFCGFNIPTKIIKQTIDAGIQDKNHYDYLMSSVYSFIKQACADHCQPSETYLIGTLENDELTFKHELAHAFFATNTGYSKMCQTYLNPISKTSLERLYLGLKNAGYDEAVYFDELQAYMIGNADAVFKKALRSKKCKKEYEEAQKNMLLLFDGKYNKIFGQKDSVTITI
jgi:hypothetical protein